MALRYYIEYRFNEQEFNKSIYNCTDMPKLEFQKVENHYFDDFEDDMINI